MKKQKSVIFYGLFFIASLIGELYCLLEFRDDLINIIGVGIVLLIAAYLWLDSVLNVYLDDRKRMDERINDLEKIQKATFIMTKDIKSNPGLSKLANYKDGNSKRVSD